TKPAATVKVVDPLIAPEAAAIAVCPGVRALASPPVLIVATAAVDELHIAVLVRFCVLPSLYVPVAVNCCVAPAAIEAFAGVTAIETSVGAVTVSVVEPLRLLVVGLTMGGAPVFTPVDGPPGRRVGGAAAVAKVAMMLGLPAATPVARPAAVIVATPGAEELQATEAVRFCVLPSLLVPVAVNCSVFPAAIEGFAGVTAMETSPLALPAPPGAITLGPPE